MYIFGLDFDHTFRNIAFLFRPKLERVFFEMNDFSMIKFSLTFDKNSLQLPRCLKNKTFRL